MRRLYVAPLGIHIAHKEIHPPTMTYWMGLYTPGMEELWHTQGQPVIITADYLSARHQDLWEQHPQVTVLPHPLYEATMPLHEAMQKEDNLANTHDGVQALTAVELFGIDPSHTVQHVHKQLATWHRAFRLRFR